MDQDRRQRVESLFDQALDLGSDEQAQFLDRECGEEDQLRSEVEGLLRANSSSGDFLDGHVEASAAPVVNVPGETEPDGAQADANEPRSQGFS